MKPLAKAPNKNAKAITYASESARLHRMKVDPQATVAEMVASMWTPTLSESLPKVISPKIWARFAIASTTAPFEVEYPMRVVNDGRYINGR